MARLGAGPLFQGHIRKTAVVLILRTVKENSCPRFFFRTIKEKVLSQVFLDTKGKRSVVLVLRTQIGKLLSCFQGHGLSIWINPLVPRVQK